MRRLICLLTVLLLSERTAAAENPVIQTEWPNLRQQLATRGLLGRSARIALSGGASAKTKVLELTETALVVSSTKSTARWRSGEGKASIPKEIVISIRFTAKPGHRGAYGALIGLGAGAAVFAAVVPVSGYCYDAVACAMAGAALPIAAVAGYCIGRASAPPAPEFILKP